MMRTNSNKSNLAVKRSNSRISVLCFKDAPEEDPVKKDFLKICEDGSPR